MTEYACVYVMTNDSCFAPSVTKHYLTLACCKGAKKPGNGLRDSAQKKFHEGDSVWLIGVAGKKLIKKLIKERINEGGKLDYHPVYIAKITDCVPIEEYYDRSNSETCRYSAQKDWQSYIYSDGKFTSQEGVNEHHGNADDIKKDTLPGSFALVSDGESFHYFGRSLGEFDNYPPLLKKLRSRFSNSPRGHCCLELTEEDIIDLHRVLENFNDNGWRNQGITENSDDYAKRVARS